MLESGIKTEKSDSHCFLGWFGCAEVCRDIIELHVLLHGNSRLRLRDGGAVDLGVQDVDLLEQPCRKLHRAQIFGAQVEQVARQFVGDVLLRLAVHEHQNDVLRERVVLRTRTPAQFDELRVDNVLERLAQRPVGGDLHGHGGRRGRSGWRW
jgi:hypothetical protein